MSDISEDELDVALPSDSSDNENPVEEDEELMILSDNEDVEDEKNLSDEELDIVPEDEDEDDDDEEVEHIDENEENRPCGPRPTKNNNAYTLNELRAKAIKQGHAYDSIVRLKIPELCQLLNLTYTNSKMLFDDFPSCLKTKKSEVINQHKEILNAKGITTKMAKKIKKDVLCDLIYKDKSPFTPPNDFKESQCQNYNFPTLKRIAVNIKVDTARAKTHADYCRLIALHYLRKNLTFNAVRNPYWNDVMGEDKCLTPLSKNLELQKHQKTVVRHILKHRSLLAVHATGTGKTLAAATAINCMLAKYPNIRIVVVTPLSLVDNFFKNLVKFGIDIKDPEFVSRVDIKSYEEYVNEQRRKGQLDCRNTFLIVDEAHNLRTDYKIASTDLRSGSKAWTIMLCASQAFKVLLLSATPIVNDVFDLRNLIMMLDGTHPDDAMTKLKFQELASEQIDEMLRCKVSYYEAPQEFFPQRIDIPLEETTLYMTPEYLAKYREIERENSSILSSGYLQGSVLVSQFYHKLRVSINALEGEESPKINWIMDFLEKEIEAGRKTIVFSNWKKAGMNILRKRLDALNMKNLYAYVTGDVPKEIRELIKLKYNANKIKVLLITRAGGEGLDLHETRNIIIMESNWNPSIDAQIIGRGIRYKSHINLPPEEQNVRIYRLMLQKPEGWEKTFMTENQSVDQVLYDLSYKQKAPMMETLTNIMKDMSIENQICDCNDDEKSYIEGCQTIEITPKRKVKPIKKKKEVEPDVPKLIEFDEDGNIIISEEQQVARKKEEKEAKKILSPIESVDELKLFDEPEPVVQFDEPEDKPSPKQVKPKQKKAFTFIKAEVKEIKEPEVKEEKEIVLQLDDDDEIPLSVSEDEIELSEGEDLLTKTGSPKARESIIEYEEEETSTMPIVELSESEEEEEKKKPSKNIYIAEKGLTSLALNPREIGGPVWARLAGVYEKIGKRIGRKQKILTVQFDEDREANENEKDIELVDEDEFGNEFTVNTEVDLELVDDADDEGTNLEYDDETVIENVYDNDRTLSTKEEIEKKESEDELKLQESDDELKLQESDDELKLQESDDELDLIEDEFKFMVMLAKSAKGTEDVKGWWHSEKLDGVRAIWTGKRMLSRNNKEYILPSFFSKLLPKDTPLDGELFIGRGKFQKTTGIVRHKTPNEKDWKFIKYMIYDIPLPNIPFEERYEMIKRIVKKACGIVRECPLVVLEQIKLKDREHLNRLHSLITSNGGEGSIIRKPGSLYENKRSGNLLKIKPDDEIDARVIDYQKGTGKYVGMLGSLIVELVDDPTIQFNVGTGLKDDDRQDYKRRFPKGTIIRVKYNGLTDRGVPRFPTFDGVHIDR